MPVNRRDRRQLDTSLLPPPAPILWVVGSLNAATDNTLLALVYQAFPTPAAVPWAEVGPNPDFPMTLSDGTVPLDSWVSDFGGLILLTAVFPIQPFLFQNTALITPWNERFRGKNGEWLAPMVQLVEPNATPSNFIMILEVLENAGDAEVRWCLTSGGAAVTVTAIPNLDDMRLHQAGLVYSPIGTTIVPSGIIIDFGVAVVPGSLVTQPRLSPFCTGPAGEPTITRTAVVV